LLVEQDFIDKFEATPDVAEKLGHHILELQDMIAWLTDSST
jgi:hypothetical protein